MHLNIKKEIAQSLELYLSTHNISQADFSKKANVPKEYLSLILKKNSNFKYSAGEKEGDIPSKYFHLMAKQIGYNLQESFWKTQATPQLAKTLSILNDARENGSTNIIIGETGAGKSYACSFFQKKYPIDVFIVKAGRHDTLPDLLDKIISAIGVRTNVRRRGKQIQEIIKHLISIRFAGNFPTLIIDESEYLKLSALCAIKELYDELIHFCSIVLIGTEQLVDNLERMKKRNRPGMPQFYRRVKFGIKNLPLINKKYEDFVKDIECKHLIKFVRRYCENYGELHDLIVPAKREVKRLGVELTLQLVRQVHGLSDNEYPI